MVTSCFKQNKNKPKKQKRFPLIAYHKWSDKYVLLTSESNGTVLVSRISEEIGLYQEIWNFGRCPEDWAVISDAKITVSN